MVFENITKFIFVFLCSYFLTCTINIQLHFLGVVYIKYKLLNIQIRITISLVLAYPSQSLIKDHQKITFWAQTTSKQENENHRFHHHQHRLFSRLKSHVARHNLCGAVYAGNGLICYDLSVKLLNYWRSRFSGVFRASFELQTRYSRHRKI